jgi:hypothetical protein
MSPASYAHHHVCPYCQDERPCEAMHCAGPDRVHLPCWPCRLRGLE